MAFWVIVIVLFSSCSRKKEKLPVGIWEKRQMVEFLTQAQLVEARLVTENSPLEKRDSFAEIYYNQLFTTYDTNKESWEQNLFYYRNYPDKLNEIYANVLSELSIMETELQAGNKEEKRVEQASDEQKEISDVTN